VKKNIVHLTNRRLSSMWHLKPLVFAHISIRHFDHVGTHRNSWQFPDKLCCAMICTYAVRFLAMNQIENMILTNN